MDHEYSISGKLWIGSQPVALPQEYSFSDNLFVISADGSITPKDPRTAEYFSEDNLRALCCQLSQKFGVRVRLEKLHEEYGLLNVFNGGSDYEVVTAERFTCEYENGQEISCNRQKI
jgi:hypothetical protein